MNLLPSKLELLAGVKAGLVPSSSSSRKTGNGKKATIINSVGDDTIEYDSKSYWSTTATNIEEMLKTLSIYDATTTGDTAKISTKRKEIQGKNGTALAKSLGPGAIPLDSRIAPEWDKMCMFLYTKADGGLHHTISLCDNVIAVSDNHPSTVLLQKMDDKNQTSDVVSAKVADSSDHRSKMKPPQHILTAAAANAANCHNAMYRVGSHWSFYERDFSYIREICTVIDIDTIVTPYVARTYNYGTMNNQSRSSSNSTHRDKKEQTGSRSLGLLRGKTVDGRMHVRPLCTPGDLTIALREISNPDIFEIASVSVPAGFQGHGEDGSYHVADKYTYYRYYHKLNEPGLWVKMCIPDETPADISLDKSSVLNNGVKKMSDKLQAQSLAAQKRRWMILRDYLCPHLHSFCFTHEVIETIHVTPAMELAGKYAISAMQASLDILNNEAGSVLLTEAVLDFQLLEERNQKPKGPPRVGSRAFNRLSLKQQMGIRADAKELAEKDAKQLPMPSSAPWGRHYRLFHVVHTKTAQRYAQNRRKEIHAISTEKRLFMKHFALSFQEQFSQLFVITQEEQIRSRQAYEEAKKLQEIEDSKLGKVSKHHDMNITDTIQTPTAFLSEEDDIQYNVAESLLLDAAEEAMVKNATGEKDIIMMSQLPPPDQRQMIPINDPHELMISHPLFKEKKLHVKNNQYNQSVLQLAAKEALLLAEELWNTMRKRQSSRTPGTRTRDQEEEKNQQKLVVDVDIDLPIVNKNQESLLQSSLISPVDAHSLQSLSPMGPGSDVRDSSIDTSKKKELPLSLQYADEIEKYERYQHQQLKQMEMEATANTAAEQSNNTLGYLAEYMQKAFQLRILGADAADVAQKQKDNAIPVLNEIVGKKTEPVLPESLKRPSSPLTNSYVAAMGAQMQAHLGHARMLHHHTPEEISNVTHHRASTKVKREWEEDIPEYVTFLKLWEKVGNGKKKKGKKKAAPVKKSTKSTSKKGKGVPIQVMYRNPLNQLVSPRLDLEAEAARQRKQREHVQQDNVGNMKLDNGPPVTIPITVETIIRAPRDKFAISDSDEIIAADSMARNLSLTDVLTGRSLVTSNNHSDNNTEHETVEVSIADAVRDKVTRERAAKIVKEERMAHEQAFHENLIRAAHSAAEIGEKEKEADLSTTRLSMVPDLNFSEVSDKNKDNSAENLDLRRELDPSGDWPNFQSKMDQKFYPFVSFERPGDNEKLARQYDALGAATGVTHEPTRFNSSLADERERESNEMLELFMSFMPATLAHKVRNGISARARIVYMKRRAQLKKQKRKDDISREEELADYFKNLDKWQYIDENDEDNDPSLEMNGMCSYQEPPEPETHKRFKRPTVLLPPPKREITRFLRTMVNLNVRRTLLDGELVSKPDKKFTMIEKYKIAQNTQRQETLEEGSEDESSLAETTVSSALPFAKPSAVAKQAIQDSEQINTKNITHYAERAGHVAAQAAIRAVAHDKIEEIAVIAEKKAHKKAKKMELASRAGGGKLWGPPAAHITDSSDDSDDTNNRNKISKKNKDENIPISSYMQSMHDNGEQRADPCTYIDRTGNIYRDQLTGHMVLMKRIPEAMNSAIQKYMEDTLHSLPDMIQGNSQLDEFDEDEERPESEEYTAPHLDLLPPVILDAENRPILVPQEEYSHTMSSPGRTRPYSKEGSMVPAVFIHNESLISENQVLETTPATAAEAKARKRSVPPISNEQINDEVAQKDKYVGTKTKGLLIMPGHNLTAVTKRQPIRPSTEIPSSRTMKVTLTQPSTVVEVPTFKGSDRMIDSLGTNRVSLGDGMGPMDDHDAHMKLAEARNRLRIELDMDDELPQTPDAPLVHLHKDQKNHKDDHDDDEEELYKKEYAAAAYAAHVALEETRAASPLEYKIFANIDQIQVNSAPIPYLQANSSLADAVDNSLDVEVRQAEVTLASTQSLDPLAIKAIKSTPQKNFLKNNDSKASLGSFERPPTSLLLYGDSTVILLDPADADPAGLLLLVPPSPEKIDKLEEKRKTAAIKAEMIEIKNETTAILTEIINQIEAKEAQDLQHIKGSLEAIVNEIELNEAAEINRQAKEAAAAAIAAAPKVGSFFSFKVEKPKHPPVRHTSMRLYNPQAILAKRIGIMEKKQKREAQRLEEERNRDMGLPIGVTLSNFLALSNRAIYGNEGLEEGDEDEETETEEGIVVNIPQVLDYDHTTKRDAQCTAMTDNTDFITNEETATSAPMFFLPSEKVVEDIDNAQTNQQQKIGSAVNVDTDFAHYLPVTPSENPLSIKSMHDRSQVPAGGYDGDKAIIVRAQNLVRSFIESDTTESLIGLPNVQNFNDNSIDPATYAEHPEINVSGMSLQDYNPTIKLGDAQGAHGDKYGLEGAISAGSPKIPPPNTEYTKLAPDPDAIALIFTAFSPDDASLMGVKSYTQTQLPPKRPNNKPNRMIKQPITSLESSSNIDRTNNSIEKIYPAASGGIISPRAPLTAKPLSAVHGRRAVQATRPIIHKKAPNSPVSPPTAIIGNKLTTEKNKDSNASEEVIRGPELGVLFVSDDQMTYKSDTKIESTVPPKSILQLNSGPSSANGTRPTTTDVSSRNPDESTDSKKEEENKPHRQVTNASSNNRKMIPSTLRKKDTPRPDVVSAAIAATQSIRLFNQKVETKVMDKEEVERQQQRDRLQAELKILEAGMNEEESRQEALLQHLIQEQGVNLPEEVLKRAVSATLLGDNPEQILSALTSAARNTTRSPQTLLVTNPVDGVASGYGYPVVPPPQQIISQDPFIGNKSPARMSGKNTTMANPQPYYSANITDIGHAIGIMRMPLNNDNDEEIDEQRIENDQIEKTRSFDPIEPPSRESLKGPDTGAILSIKSGLSSSQEGELAFLDEEKRRKHDLSTLRNQMQIQATSAPLGKHRSPEEKSKVSTIKSTAFDKKQREAKVAMPLLELVPPAPMTKPPDMATQFLQIGQIQSPEKNLLSSISTEMHQAQNMQLPPKAKSQEMNSSHTMSVVITSKTKEVPYLPIQVFGEDRDVLF